MWMCRLTISWVKLLSSCKLMYDRGGGFMRKITILLADKREICFIPKGIKETAKSTVFFFFFCCCSNIIHLDLIQDLRDPALIHFIGF